MMSNTTTRRFSRRLTQVSPNRRVLLAALLLLALAVSDGLAEPAAEAASRVRQQPTWVAVTDQFEFHSDPWINLHHFLYQWARGDEGLGTGRWYVPVQERSSLAPLSSDERDGWLQAVAFYRDSVAGRGLFDDEMLQLKQELLALGGDPQERPPNGISGIAAALAIAMPVYQARWWPHHDQTNRAWTANVVPLLRRHEAGFVELTTRVYGAKWPGARRRVDVSAYANPRAGYTAMGHTVMYSTDPGNQHLYALEMLLHEVQHVREVGSSGRRELTAAFESAGTDLPRNLWHALIFATAGAFTQSLAEDEGLAEHTPYWIREGFESFQGWSKLVPAVREHWLPVVRGDASREDGFAALAGSFSSQ